MTVFAVVPQRKSVSKQGFEASNVIATNLKAATFFWSIECKRCDNEMPPNRK